MSVLKLLISMVMLMSFMKNWNLVQEGLFVLSFLAGVWIYHDFGVFGVGFNLGLDMISYIMVMLSFWIMALVILASFSIKFNKKFSSSFILVNLLLLMCLLITFSATEYMMLYIFFEASLIPTLILILGWGYQPERIQAGVYMLFYTLFFSLPLLGSLLLLNFFEMSLMMKMEMFMYGEGSSFIISIWYLLSIMAFLVKLPMYTFHLWLPKAHVEAPVAGSMILAGVLLKLGGYGLIRILSLFQSSNKELSWVFMSMGLIGGAMVSLMCLRQVDMKSLIAYSSVAHMGLVLCGVVTFSYWGFSGGVVVMVGHGLCSSGLFCLANIIYERLGSRSLLVSKGLLSFMPSMGLWWFLLSVSNMASPPSLNLLGEINLIISVLNWELLTLIGLVMLSFFSGGYTLYMYSMSQHGLFFNSVYSCCSGKVREYIVLFLHWLPLNILILNINVLEIFS
uniref:NADH-ubiquinone oxidoreductase chain 4 n=1 Tax=Damithrax spinosissimus TaxID=765936 RepID=A0A0U1XG65_DAMSP|nr:NADH dehydrogenase subunit 4 [Damithrax spinosissimus]AIT75856.1 NADH dehydrogenase subunit 4 [Damithrax spinosissimus]